MLLPTSSDVFQRVRSAAVGIYLVHELLQLSMLLHILKIKLFWGHHVGHNHFL